MISMNEDLSFMLWHQRLGHMSTKELEVLSKHGFFFFFPDLKNINLDFCEYCVLDKQKKISFKLSDIETDYKILDLVYSNIYNLISVSTFGSISYFVTFIDHASRKL